MLEHDLVDALLRRGVTARFLADADTRGIAARQRKNLFRHEAVVQYDVCLLQRAQCIQRQQAWISRPGTDERDRTGERLVAHCQQSLQRALGVRLTAVTHAPGDVAAHQRLIEAAATGNVRQRRLDAQTPALEHCRQRAERAVDQHLDPLAYEPGQHGRHPAARDRDHQRRAIDDGRNDDARALCVVNHVGEDIRRAGRLGHQRIDCRIVRCGDDQDHACKLGRVELSRDPRHRSTLARGEPVRKFR